MNVRTFIPFLTFIASANILHLQAQETLLSSVPMQGGMVMPAIRYIADHGHLMITLPSETPHLTPLEESYPGIHFSPNSPWYEDLDPDHEGKAFNRQYGFVMDGTSDLLPLGTAIWIQLVNADLGLEAYTYRRINESEQTWEPMFGTKGSSKVFEWDMRMFHPAFVAPQGSGPLSAEFEAFVVDLNTMERKIEIGGVFFTLLWTAEHSDILPDLEIAQRIVLRWLQPVGHSHLQSTMDLQSGDWQSMPQSPVMIDGYATVILDSTYKGMFFRLVSHEDEE